MGLRMRLACADAARAVTPRSLRLTSLLDMAQTMQVHQESDLPVALMYLQMPHHLTQNHFTHITQRIQWLQMQQRLLAQGLGRFLQRGSQSGAKSLLKNGKGSRQNKPVASGKQVAGTLLTEQTWMRWLQTLVIRSQERQRMEGNAIQISGVASSVFSAIRQDGSVPSDMPPMLKQLLTQPVVLKQIIMKGATVSGRQNQRWQTFPSVNAGLMTGMNTVLTLLQHQVRARADVKATAGDRKASGFASWSVAKSEISNVFSSMQAADAARGTRLEQIVLRSLAQPGGVAQGFDEHGRHLINAMRTHSSVALEMRSGARAVIETLLPWYLRSQLRDVGNALANKFLLQGAQKRWQRTVMRAHEARVAAAERLLLRVLRLRTVKNTAVSTLTPTSTSGRQRSSRRQQIAGRQQPSNVIWQTGLRQYVLRQIGQRSPSQWAAQAGWRRQSALHQPMLRQSAADRVSLAVLNRMGRWNDVADRMRRGDMLAPLMQRVSLLTTRHAYSAQRGENAVTPDAPPVTMTLPHQAFAPPLEQPSYQHGMVAQPMELVPYRPRQNVTQILRETHVNRTWQAGLQVQLQKMIQHQLQTVEQTLQMKVMQELTQRNHETLRQAVSDSLFSPPIMRVLTDRLCTAVEKRAAIEQYRKGAN